MERNHQFIWFNAACMHNGTYISLKKGCKGNNSIGSGYYHKVLEMLEFKNYPKIGIFGANLAVL